MRVEVKKILLFVVFLLCVALVTVVLFNLESIINAFTDDGEADTESGDINVDLNAVYIDGEVYIPRRNVRNYLIIGVDKFGDADGAGVAQADFIMVLSFDGNSDTYTMIPINRDTMTEVDIYNYFDGSVNTPITQIALSHNDGTYEGISNHKKCKNTAKALSRLLYGVEFDGYVSMTMDAVKLIVDYIGGVPISFEEDMTEIDQSFAKGETVTLDGELALRLIRARGGLSDSSNVFRMERQRAFLEAFVGRMDELALREEELAVCFEQTSSYMVAEKGVDTFYEMFGKMSRYDRAELIPIPGEAVVGDRYVEFYVDGEGVKDIVRNVFFEKVH